jgi:hypothetical protein
LAGAGGGAFWADAVVIPCADGKARLVPREAEPVIRSLADARRFAAGEDLGGMRTGALAPVPSSEAFPLAYGNEWGAGSRTGMLRGAGNAVVPALAAVFVRAVLDCLP